MNNFNKNESKKNVLIVFAISTFAIISGLSIAFLKYKALLIIGSGIALLIIVLFKPFYGLCFLTFSIPYAGVLQIAPKLTGNKLFAIWVLVSILIKKLAKKELIDIFIPDGLVVYFIFYFWSLLTFPFTYITDDSITALLSKGFLLGFVFLVTAMIQDYRQFNIICIVTAAGASFLGIYICFFGMGTLVGEYGTRLAAGTNENVLAHALGVGLLLSFFSLKELPKKAKYIILALDMFTIYAILLTGSRGTWLALIFSIIFLPLITSKIPMKTRLNYVFLGSLTTFTVFIGLTYNLFGQWGLLVTDRLLEHESIIQASGGRLNYIWPFFLKKVAEMPITGWGTGYSQYLGRSAHNDLLFILVETGAVGLILFILFLIFTLKDIIFIKDTTLRLLALMLFFFLLLSGTTHNTVSLKSYALAIGTLFFIAKMRYMEAKDSLPETEPKGS